MSIIKRMMKIFNGKSSIDSTLDSVIKDDKKTARERELSARTNGSNDFIMTPDSIHGTNFMSSSPYIR